MPIRAAILSLALYNLVLGLWMAIDPHSFYVALGPFGAANNHYVRDTATFNLAIGAALLAALWRPAWQPALLFASAAQWTLHALNHLADIDRAHPHWVGVFDFLALLAGAALLAVVAAMSIRKEATG